MKVAVYIGGAQHGFWTAVAGEGRWAFNLADMLASRGHEVHCIGTGRGGHEAPQWGSQPPVPNVRMLHPRDIDPNLEYDALVNVPWDWHDAAGHLHHCPNPMVKAKKYLHCIFGWNLGIEESTINRYKCPVAPYNHIITLPYPPMSSYEHGIDIKPLYLPFFDGLFDSIDPATRNQYTWTCKDVFLDEWREDMTIHTEGLKVLQSLVYLSDKYNIHCNFISAGCFSSKRAQRMGAHELFMKIKHKTVNHTPIPINILKSYMAKSRVITPLPGYFAGCWDAVVQGAIALNHESCGQAKMVLKNQPQLTDSMSQKEVQDIMERIFTDDHYYMEVIREQRALIHELSYENVHKQFLAIVEGATSDKA